MSTALAEISSTFQSIRRLEKLGGTDSLFGQMHVFQELLKDEHEKIGATSGMFSFHGMGQYGNIIEWIATVRAIKAFMDHGYTAEHLEALRKWYEEGVNSQPDERIVGCYIRLVMQEDDPLAYIARQEELQAKVEAANEKG